jgi:hypothetical protein
MNGVCLRYNQKLLVEIRFDFLMWARLIWFAEQMLCWIESKLGKINVVKLIISVCVASHENQISNLNKWNVCSLDLVEARWWSWKRNRKKQKKSPHTNKELKILSINSAPFNIGLEMIRRWFNVHGHNRLKYYRGINK